MFLKQSTPATLLIGPIVDSTDASVETGQTITQTDVLLWKQGGGLGFSAKSDASGCTHQSNGIYTCPLNSTDTELVGRLTVSVLKSGCLVFSQDYEVVPANVYDSLFSTDKLQVDVVELNSVAASAANLERAASVIARGTVTDSGHTPTTTAFKSADLTDATDDHFIGRPVTFTSGNLRNQQTVITDYVGSTGVFTVEALTEAPASGDAFFLS